MREFRRIILFNFSKLFHPISHYESISISMMDKTRVESQERSGWVLRKPFEGGAGTVPLRRRGERSLKPSRL